MSNCTNAWLANDLRRKLNDIFNNSPCTISTYIDGNFAGLQIVDKEQPMIRVRETDGEVIIDDCDIPHDFMIALTKDGFYLIEYKNNQYRDYFNKVVLPQGKGTSIYKGILLNEDQLLGALMVIFCL